MKALKQRFRHDPANGVIGDCHRAAIASILELELDDVPHFCALPGGDWEWVDAERIWLATRGVARVSVPFREDSLAVVLGFMARINPGLYYILGGTSRNGTGHSVVARDDAIVHDPALDDAGIVAPMEDGHYWVTVYSRAMRKLRLIGDPRYSRIANRCWERVLKQAIERSAGVSA